MRATRFPFICQNQRMNIWNHRRRRRIISRYLGSRGTSETPQSSTKTKRGQTIMCEKRTKSICVCITRSSSVVGKYGWQWERFIRFIHHRHDPKAFVSTWPPFLAMRCLHHTFVPGIARQTSALGNCNKNNRSIDRVIRYIRDRLKQRNRR